MFVLKLTGGSQINGSDMTWDSVPADVVIESISAKVTRRGVRFDSVTVDDEYSGFEAYGFQMYDIAAFSDRAVISRGLQLLCVSGDRFLTVDINLVSGQRRCTWQPMTAMTYNRSLLRPGIGR